MIDANVGYLVLSMMVAAKHADRDDSLPPK